MAAKRSAASVRRFHSRAAMFIRAALCPASIAIASRSPAMKQAKRSARRHALPVGALLVGAPVGRALVAGRAAAVMNITGT
jgi:hypothetical protein